MSVLKLKELVKTYTVPKSSSHFSVQVPELMIEKGEFFALLGPSGCGKTTLLKMIAGLLSPDRGQIFWEDEDITRVAPEKRQFSMVFQQPLLFPHMNVLENISFGLRMQKLPRRECIERAINMLEAVGLSGFEKRFPSELSGGQQQRVSIARALVTRPKLLLMDEPFSALDPSLRQEMRELVSHLHRENQVSVIFVTHDQEEAFLVADRIGVMKTGQIHQVGKPQHLYEQPSSFEVATFLGAKNVIFGEIADGTFHSPDLHIPLEHRWRDIEGQGWLVLRPEIFRLQPLRSSTSEASISNLAMHSLHGTVKEAAYSQGFYYLKVAIGSQQLELIQTKSDSWNPTAGEAISLDVPLSQIHWIPANG